MGKTTVLLVEDHDVVREGLRALIQTQADMQVVGEAANGQVALEMVRKLSPDVVVMDVSMPELNGLEATRQILSMAPKTKVLVLTSYDSLECVDEMIDSGALGFLSKRSAADHFAEAIRAVRMGRRFYGPEATKQLRDRQAALAREGRKEGNPFVLTGRQEEVLQLISEGHANKGIASRLGISIKTVEKHRQTTMDKLNIHDTAGLTRYAISKGMVPEEVAIQQPENSPISTGAHSGN